MMSIETNAADPWAMTIGLLGQLRGERKEAVRARPRKSASRCATRTAVVGLSVRVIERSTDTRLTLAYRDPSRCAYGDQEWYLTRARRSGVCAVTGREIRRGEEVYRPRPMRPQALNADAMIHSFALPTE